MNYDYIIKGGTMIDFDKSETFTGDLYIKGDRIAAPEPGEEATADHVVEAAGKLVVPGLIDEHAHWAFEIGSLGLNADMACPSAGVTTTVDAGSTGIENFEAFYRSDVLRSITDIRAYLHIASNGVLIFGHEEDQYPAAIDTGKVLALFDKYPDCLRGLKVRLSQHTMQYGLEPLRAAVELADKVNAAGHFCTVAVHVANIPKDLRIEEVLSMLRPGDVYTHPYQNLGPTIFDESGHVLACLKQARQRGVLFSGGMGSIHWTLDNLKKAYADGFFPDFISSDIITSNVYLRPGFNLLYPMCTSLMSGMSAIDVLRAVTVDPAKHLKLEGIGQLKPGYRADVAILDLVDRDVEFVDRFGGKACAKQVFEPLMTIKSGKPVFRQIYFDGGYDYKKVEKNFV